MQPTSYFAPRLIGDVGTYVVHYHAPVASIGFVRGFQEFPDPWGAYRTVNPVVTISFAASQAPKPTKRNANGYRSRQRKGRSARQG